MDELKRIEWEIKINYILYKAKEARNYKDFEQALTLMLEDGIIDLYAIKKMPKLFHQARYISLIKGNRKFSNLYYIGRGRYGTAHWKTYKAIRSAIQHFLKKNGYKVIVGEEKYEVVKN
jgi:hypothetical protein